MNEEKFVDQKIYDKTCVIYKRTSLTTIEYIYTQKIVIRKKL